LLDFGCQDLRSDDGQQFEFVAAVGARSRMQDDKDGAVDITRQPLAQQVEQADLGMQDAFGISASYGYFMLCPQSRKFRARVEQIADEGRNVHIVRAPSGGGTQVRDM
jgi:hypothetical protein